MPAWMGLAPMGFKGTGQGTSGARSDPGVVGGDRPHVGLLTLISSPPFAPFSRGSTHHRGLWHPHLHSGHGPGGLLYYRHLHAGE